MDWEGTEGQNMRPNRLSHIYIYNSSKNTVLFVNPTIGFSENLFLVIVAFLQNTTIKYSLEFVCVCICVCVCVFLHDNSKNKYRSRNMKFKHIVAYENISVKFDIGHCRVKVKLTV